MGNKHVLLASFVDPHDIDEAYDSIEKHAGVRKSNIFVFRSLSISDLIFTYNVDMEKKNIRFNQIWPDTIAIHRKKETNTLFSINAMNELIKEENNGQLIMSHKIDWEKYRNCFLLFRNGSLSIFELELIKLNR